MILGVCIATAFGMSVQINRSRKAHVNFVIYGDPQSYRTSGFKQFLSWTHDTTKGPNRAAVA